MVFPPGQHGSVSEGQKGFLDCFSQAIERYKKSVMEASDAAKPTSSPEVPSKKRPPTYTVNDEISMSKTFKLPKIASPERCTDNADSGADGDSESPGDTPAEIEKKRLASRVSSRRTREREKLRMDHFRNAKLKLQEENKKLQDENEEIRGLIKKIKDEKSSLARKTAAVQAMLVNSNSTQPQFPMQGLQGRASGIAGLQQPQIPLAPMVPSQQSMAALLLQAIVHPQIGNQAQPAASLPPAPSPQEQQLLSLLGLVSTNPALAQLLIGGQNQIQHQPQIPQHPLLSASLQPSFAAPSGSSQIENSTVLRQNLLNLFLSGSLGTQAGGQGAQ